MKKINVAIMVGSDSDLSVFAAAAKILDDLDISYHINVASAHRTPRYVEKCVRDAEKAGARVFITGAGMSAALPGVVASQTYLPVIGVPVEGKTLSGMDALLSIVQMPPGIPVATVALGKAGAANAAILAAEILALTNARVRKKLREYRHKIAASVMEKDRLLTKVGIEKYISELGKK